MKKVCLHGTSRELFHKIRNGKRKQGKSEIAPRQAGLLSGGE